MMTNNEYFARITGWGRDRCIIQNGESHIQMLKLLSEYGEMCDSLAKNLSVVDDIGDQLVVLQMICQIERGRGVEEILCDCPTVAHEIILRLDELNLFQAVGQLAGLYDALMDSLLDSVFSESTVVYVWYCLYRIATLSNTTLNECLEQAWGDIRDRTGYLNTHGVFIKDEPRA